MCGAGRTGGWQLSEPFRRSGVLKGEALGYAFDEVHRDLAGAGGVALGDFARQLGDCLDDLDRLRLGEDAFLDEHMDGALTQPSARRGLADQRTPSLPTRTRPSSFRA